MNMNYLCTNVNQEKIERFVDSLINTTWMTRADEFSIDEIFNLAVDIQESFQWDYLPKDLKEEVCGRYPDIDFKKSVDLAMEVFLKSLHLNEDLTLCAIKKYLAVIPTNNFEKFLEKMLSELKFRQNLGILIEESNKEIIIDDSDEPKEEFIDWENLNLFINDVNHTTKSDPYIKVTNSLKTQTKLYLNAVKHGSPLNAQALLEKMINCLESQCDLKLWFLLMRNENLDIVLDLCDKYSVLFKAVLRFFDKFSEEIGTNYDEDLNARYCHVNLDFDEFMTVLKMFLSRKHLSKTVQNYLETKITSLDKNFSFWLDVKACM